MVMSSRWISCMSKAVWSGSSMTRRLNFYGLSLDELADKIKPFPTYRSKQIWNWVYEKGVQDFSAMNNVPIELRSNLERHFTFGNLTVDLEQVSSDGTIKRAYKLPDGQVIESVLMPYDDGRRTACISSQAGCAMGCVFCATGQMGFSRQLSSLEIFEQAARFAVELRMKNERLSNVVLMGMGEPLNNYKNVIDAVSRINKELGIGSRHITLSTVGIVPRIKRLADEAMQIGLAVSLHHSNNAHRSRLMPVNDKYPIEELLEACRYYVYKTGRRISFEWTLIENVTDTPDAAHELGKLIKGLLCHVNLIPLNTTANYSGKSSSKRKIESFVEILKKYKISATARVRRGLDIEAGCGQLKTVLLNGVKK